MKTIKHFTIFTCFILITCMLTSCALFNFDASKYVRSCLDSNVHGEFEEYAEITNSSVEDVEKIYNDFLDNDLSFLDAYNVDDARKQEFRDLFITLYKNFKYEVGEATKNSDDSYSVPVTYYKLIVFEDIAKNMEADTTTYVEEQMKAGTTPFTDDIYTFVLDYMYDGISNKLENPEYAEPQTMNVTVSKNSSNQYEIESTELQTLVESMIDMDSVQ